MFEFVLHNFQGFSPMNMHRLSLMYDFGMPACQQRVKVARNWRFCGVFHFFVVFLTFGLSKLLGSMQHIFETNALPQIEAQTS